MINRLAFNLFDSIKQNENKNEILEKNNTKKLKRSAFLFET